MVEEDAELDGMMCGRPGRGQVSSKRISTSEGKRKFEGTKKDVVIFFSKC